MKLVRNNFEVVIHKRFNTTCFLFFLNMTLLLIKGIGHGDTPYESRAQSDALDNTIICRQKIDIFPQINDPFSKNNTSASEYNWLDGLEEFVPKSK